MKKYLGRKTLLWVLAGLSFASGIAAWTASGHAKAAEAAGATPRVKIVFTHDLGQTPEGRRVEKINPARR